MDNGTGIMVLGVVILIVVIAILMKVNKLMGTVSKRSEEETARVVEAPAPVFEAAQATLPNVPAARVLEEAATGELAMVAGLTAVVMAAADTGNKYVVRAIRRVDGGAWAHR